MKTKTQIAPKTAKVRARLMYLVESDTDIVAYVESERVAKAVIGSMRYPERYRISTVFSLPADAASVEAMEVAVAKALCKEWRGPQRPLNWARINPHAKRSYMDLARAALTALSIEGGE